MRKRLRPTARDLVTAHRDLVDAEYALNGDGGGGMLSEVTGKPQTLLRAGCREELSELSAEDARSRRPRLPAAARAIPDL